MEEWVDGALQFMHLAVGGRAVVDLDRPHGIPAFEGLHGLGGNEMGSLGIASN